MFFVMKLVVHVKEIGKAQCQIHKLSRAKACTALMGTRRMRPMSTEGMPYRLRHTGFWRSLVEPARGTDQAILPEYWRQTVLVLDHGTPTWIGIRVGAHRRTGWDLSRSRHVGDGFISRP